MCPLEGDVIVGKETEAQNRESRTQESVASQFSSTHNGLLNYFVQQIL
jgi:hypothetical protein